MAAAVSVGLYAPEAAALVLGPITVQSALGEPLRAEIDLPQITSAEAESLRASTASAEVFRAQGMEYSATARQVQVQLHRRPDGRSVLRLRGSSAVNEPFVDLVIDARWSTGQITRSYTMLFDPPALRRAPVPVTAPQMAAPAAGAAPAPLAEPVAQPAAPQRPEPATTSVPATAPTPAAAAEPRKAPARAARTAPAPSEETVKVAPGDTAGRIATARRPSGVSLDQMLVALMRSNPEAFIQGNVNRLKAGAVLQMPSGDEARATPSNEARQIIAVQSRDFNEFRRKLARVAPATQQAAAERSARGSVQTRTEDNRTAAAAPDKLTLSKGALQGKKTTEELLAQRKQGNEASARAEELSKNIDELNRLSAASASAAPGTPKPAASGAKAGATGVAVPNPGIPLPASPATPAPAAAPAAPDAPATPATTAAAAPAATPPAAAPATVPAEPPAPAPSDAPAPGAAAPSPAEAGTPAPAVAPAPEPAVAVVIPPPAAPTPAPEPAPGFLSELLEDPMVPLAGGALAALLLGYGAYRVLQRRRNQAPQDSTFMDSRVQPDSFFGGSGGQRVDTADNDTGTGGSSLAFTSSQLDAGGEVDPVAEADVYLAYGRDLQAEEILKEAARQNPERVSVHVKLAEIYAKRQDRKALEAVAQSVNQLTQGTGPDWARVTALGRELDPDHPLYQSGGAPGAAAGADVSASAAPAAAAGLAGTLAATGAALPPQSPDHPLDFDLDLNLLDDAPTSEPVSFAAAAAAAATAPSLAKPTPSDFDDALDAAPPEDDIELPALDFGSAADTPSWNAPATATAFPEPVPPKPVQEPSFDALEPLDSGPPMADIDFSMELLPAIDLPPATAAPVANEAPQEPFVLPQSGLMDFNLDHLSLDLDTPEPSMDNSSAANAPPPPPLSDDPLATKLALAQEFNTIGDSDGARTLIEEVIAESSGELKARAQRLLSELD